MRSALKPADSVNRAAPHRPLRTRGGQRPAPPRTTGLLCPGSPRPAEKAAPPASPSPAAFGPARDSVSARLGRASPRDRGGSTHLCLARWLAQKSAEPRGAPWSPAQTRRTPRNPVEPRGTPTEPRRTPRNPAEPHGATHNPAEPRGTWQNPAEPRRAPRKPAEPRPAQSSRPPGLTLPELSRSATRARLGAVPEPPPRTSPLPVP